MGCEGDVLWRESTEQNGEMPERAMARACVRALCVCMRVCMCVCVPAPFPPHLFSSCGMGPPGQAPPLLWLRLEKPPALDTACRAMPHPRFEQSDALAASGSRTNDQVLQGAVYSL